MSATLNVGMSRSDCGACGRNAFPQETHHYTIEYGHDGYSGVTAVGKPWSIPPRQGQPGCGAEFTAVTSVYTGEAMEAATKALRPDLPYVSGSEPSISG